VPLISITLRVIRCITTACGEFRRLNIWCNYRNWRFKH